MTKKEFDEIYTTAFNEAMDENLKPSSLFLKQLAESFSDSMNQSEYTLAVIESAAYLSGAITKRILEKVLDFD